ncbi:MAG: PqqD family protein [Acidobacteria bacterium]|nr:PqqD family protein [Acidobacteriota bacterium]
MKKTEHLTPRARQEELVVRELPDEMLIYDLRRHEAHCLNQTATSVWKHCDGKTTIKGIMKSLAKELQSPVDERIVRLALDQLAKFHLLDEAEALSVQLPPEMARMSRREMMRTLGVAAAVALPLIVSISAPTTAQAASCVNSGCTPGGIPCCVGTCKAGGICTSP